MVVGNHAGTVNAGVAACVEEFEINGVADAKCIDLSLARIANARGVEQGGAKQLINVKKRIAERKLTGL